MSAVRRRASGLLPRATFIGVVLLVSAATTAVVPAGAAVQGGPYTQIARLAAGDPSPSDLFGYSATSASGGRFAIGAPGADHAGHVGAGAVYVFTPDGAGGYTETAKLVADDTDLRGGFGLALATSADDRMVAGALAADHNGQVEVGAAYVFAPDGAGGYTQTAKLTAADADSFARFGYRVAMAGDRVVVGATWAHHSGKFYAGAVYVFSPDGAGGYTQTAKLVAGDADHNDQLGDSLAVAGDIIVSGAAAADHSGHDAAGAVYVFAPDGAGGYTQTAKLVAADASEGARFGVSAVAANDRIIIGASWAGHSGHDAAGAVYVFTSDGAGGYTQTARLTAADPGYRHQFGHSVATMGDDIVVGAPVTAPVGAVYVFSPDGAGGYTQTAKLTPKPGQGGVFGGSLAIAGDRLAIGSQGESYGGHMFAGAAYVYEPGDVRDPEAAAAALRHAVIEIDPDDTKRNLIRFLDRIEREIAHDNHSEACRALDRYLAEIVRVTDVRPDANPLPVEDATRLTALANNVRIALACPDP